MLSLPGESRKNLMLLYVDRPRKLQLLSCEAYMDFGRTCAIVAIQRKVAAKYFFHSFTYFLLSHNNHDIIIIIAIVSIWNEIKI